MSRLFHLFRKQRDIGTDIKLLKTMCVLRQAGDDFSPIYREHSMPIHAVHCQSPRWLAGWIRGNLHDRKLYAFQYTVLQLFSIVKHWGGGGGGGGCFPCKTFSMPKKSKTVKVIILKLSEFL